VEKSSVAILLNIFHITKTIKGIVHFKIKMLSSFTHPHDLFLLLNKKKEDILKNISNQTVNGPH